ncbi:hypothetical protein [Gordonia tangerina]|uniref:Uncharacterized protein n=1 Tax=Gordonia tangerina TaxID=2911060 RepID=A0ABS9DDA4_9ACTN|nr:hypothetical protein [Gordonia tangerina]MCF3937178.1 hypothetical protein [Gordonia tangerina]
MPEDREQVDVPTHGEDAAPTRPITTALRAAVEFALYEPGKCDERTVESLLWGALGESPDLAQALTGRRDLIFRLGMKDRGDIAGLPDEMTHDAAVVIEVKLRAAFNWREATDRSQLDAYADRSPNAMLILVASDKSIKDFHARGTGKYHANGSREFESYDRWAENIVPLGDLLKMLINVLKGSPPDLSAETVGRIVARKGEQ